MTTEQTLTVSGLSFELGTRKVLDQVNFDLNPSELVSIVGPNGAGKTTLLRCLCGIYSGFIGTVKLNGQDIRRLNQRQIGQVVALVPQGVSFLPGLTVREYLATARYSFKRFGHGLSREDNSLIDRSLELLDAKRFEHADLLELSGGERQKVIIAGALTQSPRLLLMDEPTSYLDPKFQVELIKLLVRLKTEQNLAILAVTHDLNVARVGADRIIGLKAGRVDFTCRSQDSSLLHALEELFDIEFLELTVGKQTIISPKWEQI